MTRNLTPDWRDKFRFGEVVYDKPDGLVICGDCLEVLPRFAPGAVHLLITSPPYNVGKNYGKHNDRKDYSEYLDKTKDILKACYKVLVSGGRILLNLPSCIRQHTGSRAAYITIDYLLILRKIGFLDREIVTWLKMPRGRVLQNATSWGSWRSPSNPALRDASELILIMSKEKHNLEGDKNKIDIGIQEFMRFTSNVWYMTPVQDPAHPAPFPKELPARAIKLYTYRDNIICDPFMGIGTACIAAKELGRRFIGIEINREYCEIAVKRLAQGVLL